MGSSNSSTDLVSDVARYSLITWCTVVLILGISGNIIIILSTRYKAIRLDKISMVLITNIAVSDLGTTLFAVHPTLISLVWNDWPYGSTLCYLLHYLQVPSFVAAVLLICALHISKLTTLVYPLRALGRSNRCAYQISVLIWFLTAILPAAQLIVDRHDVYFDKKLFRCVYSFSNPLWKRLLPAISLTLGVIPNLTVVFTTIALLIVVKRATGRTNIQGVLTALYIGSAYIVACLPVILYTSIYKGVLSYRMSQDGAAFIELHVFMFAYFSVFTNAMLNFFVYYVSVESFKIFVKRRVFSWISRIPSFYSRRIQSVSIELRSMQS